MTTIVVGVDRSTESGAALRWAAREAQLRDATVDAVLAWGYLDQYRGVKRFEPFYDGRAAERSLRDFVAEQLPESDVARVHVRAVDGFAVEELVSASSEADLLVLGPRGSGGFLGLRLGSVTDHCLEDSPCPVTVVHGERPARAPGEPETVVVGIDGSGSARAALVWAADEASRRRARLVVVHAWVDPAPRSPTSAPAVDVGVFEAAATRCVERELADLDASALDIEPEPLVVFGAAGAALLDLAERADLVVVGSRGRGLVRRVVLGSVAAEVSRHAVCPVVVVRPASSSE